MTDETRIELHGQRCSCRGGAWVLLESTQRSRCSAEGGERLVLGLTEWRQFGKPGSVEVLREAQGRVETGERRQFHRYEVSLPVRVERIPTWRDPSPQGEDTFTEVIAVGGALVRSRMALDKGEMIRFRLGPYDTRAEVMYVSGGGADGSQRLGLKFLDAPMPEDFIPADAPPLP